MGRRTNRTTNRDHRDTEQRRAGRLAPHTILLGAAVFLSPLIAGKLSDVPALALQMLVFLAAILWLARSHREGFLRLPSMAIVACTGLFFLLTLLSVMDSEGLYLSLRELANIASYLVTFVLVIGLSRDRGAIYALLGLLMISSVLVSVIGLKEYALSGMSGWRTFSTFFNPDFLAGFVAMMLPIWLGWYLSRTSAVISVLAGMATTAVFATLLITGSRFGSLAAAGGVCVTLVLAGASGSLKKPQLAKLVVLGIAALLIFGMLGKPLAGRISTARSESHSAGFRILTWKGTARMAIAHPVNGTGIGTFELAYPRYAVVGFTKLAHNSYLQLAAESGPVSVIVLLALLGVTWMPAAWSVIRRRISAGEVAQDSGIFWQPDPRLLLPGLLGGTAASVARNLVDSDWYVTGIGMAFWLILGSLVALTSSEGKTVPRASVPGIVILGVFLLGTAFMLAGEALASRGEALVAAQDLRGAEASYRLSARVNPLNPGPHRRLGGLYLAIAQSTGDPAYADMAIGELRMAIQLEPTRASAYYQLGRCYEFYPRPRQAIQAYREALRRDPNSLQALLALARAYEIVGDHGSALRTWRRMIHLENSPYEQVRAVPEMVEPAYVFAHQALGLEAERSGRIDDARREYSIALDRIRRYEEAMKSMGPVLDAAGRRNTAFEEQVRETKTFLRARIRRLQASPTTDM